MPYAIVIHAFPRTDLPLDHAQGKILHGLFYEVLKKASAAKGDEIHAAGGLKPFSTALLLNQKQRREEQLWPGEKILWCVSTRRMLPRRQNRSRN